LRLLDDGSEVLPDFMHVVASCLPPQIREEFSPQLRLLARIFSNNGYMLLIQDSAIPDFESPMDAARHRLFRSCTCQRLEPLAGEDPVHRETVPLLTHARVEAFGVQLRGDAMEA
jgi:hypothetical protein